MRTATTLVSACLTLAACGYGEGAGSWRDANLGLSEELGLFSEDETGALSSVLASAEDTPGNQGLLYVAIIDAEVASQSAGRAVVLVDQPTKVADALGEIVYALAPEAAPGWEAKSRGLVPGWNGTGYGLIRANEEMIVVLRGFSAAEGGAATADALVCVENTAARARETLDLAQSLLADTSGTDRSADLPQLERLARGLLTGLDADGDGEIAIAEGECGLRQAEFVLDALSDPGPS